MNQPIFFTPIFQERIWGGEQLTSFGYSIPSKRTGECWAFAAHENGQSIVKEGPYQGETLSQLWIKHRELFGNLPGDRFPLLTKILDANDDLSVQVHPNDDYACLHEKGDLGKTECWYIIDCVPGAEIIYGHHAKTKEELTQLIKKGNWSSLLRKVPVEKGDFFFVPSGTIHAIGKGIVLLETQQNSDTTYRVYDYDRSDEKGNKRELHIEKSIDVTTVPSVLPTAQVKKVIIEDLQVTTFKTDQYFSVYKWVIDGQAKIEQRQPFQLVSVIAGEGSICISNNLVFSFTKGDHFMLPSKVGEFFLKGKAEFIVSHV